MISTDNLLVKCLVFKKIEFILILLFNTLGCCAYVFADGRVLTQVKPDMKMIIVEFVEGGKSFIDESGDSVSIIDEITLLISKKNMEKVVGRISREGVFNSKNEMIFDARGKDVIGLSSRTIKSPTSPNYVVRRDGQYFEEDTAVVLKIDFEVDELMLLDLKSRFTE